jgi:hypothetical protein
LMATTQSQVSTFANLELPNWQFANHDGIFSALPTITPPLSTACTF